MRRNRRLSVDTFDERRIDNDSARGHDWLDHVDAQLDLDRLRHAARHDHPVGSRILLNARTPGSPGRHGHGDEFPEGARTVSATLRCLCWCGRHVYDVPARTVRAGRTVSCDEYLRCTHAEMRNTA